MQMPLIGSLAFAALLATLLAGTAIAQERPDLPGGLTPHPSAVWNDRAANTCFGGLHHGKHVLSEEHLRDARSDTTVTDCVAQGGRTGWLPRFMPVSAGERLG